jgi:hypothetical protein
MSICEYCEMAEGELARKNEVPESEGVCDACAQLDVYALFEDEHDTEEECKGCECVVCIYFYEVDSLEDGAKADVLDFWDWLPEHVRYNFRNRVEYVLRLRPSVVERIHPGQLRMFEDEC